MTVTPADPVGMEIFHPNVRMGKSPYIMDQYKFKRSHKNIFASKPIDVEG
jgi:hypothetical protein